MKVACALLAVAASAQADDATKRKGGKMKEAVMIDAKAIKWGDAPPDLPKGAQLAVLFGDPSKSGPYTMRLKAPDGYKIAPHWHTQDEQLTIVSGTLVLHMGDMTSEAHSLGVGDYHFLPGRMHHAAEAKGETVVQIHGAGPFDIRYLNPADNPNPKSAKR
jgi:mannose-6-phosphate isomerase-like protein (cupin superfamily)